MIVTLSKWGQRAENIHKEKHQAAYTAFKASPSLQGYPIPHTPTSVHSSEVLTWNCHPHPSPPQD